MFLNSLIIGKLFKHLDESIYDDAGHVCDWSIACWVADMYKPNMLLKHGLTASRFQWLYVSLTCHKLIFLCLQ